MNQGQSAVEETYAEARWAFLNVIAQYFENEDYVGQAHYLAAFCYDKLKDIEPDDAKTKAIREWQAVVTNFPKKPVPGGFHQESGEVRHQSGRAGPSAAGAPKADAPSRIRSSRSRPRLIRKRLRRGSKLKAKRWKFSIRKTANRVH